MQSNARIEARPTRRAFLHTAAAGALGMTAAQAAARVSAGAAGRTAGIAPAVTLAAGPRVETLRAWIAAGALGTLHRLEFHAAAVRGVPAPEACRALERALDAALALPGGGPAARPALHWEAAPASAALHAAHRCDGGALALLHVSAAGAGAPWVARGSRGVLELWPGEFRWTPAPGDPGALPRTRAAHAQRPALLAAHA